MSAESDSEIAPEQWWLYRQTDDQYVFAYEFSKSLLCHVQQPSDWLVRVDRADGTILFSQRIAWTDWTVGSLPIDRF